jgi:hypothetical protein
VSREPLEQSAAIAWTVIFCLTVAFWISVIGWLAS